jgi:hypothetical protein
MHRHRVSALNEDTPKYPRHQECDWEKILLALVHFKKLPATIPPTPSPQSSSSTATTTTMMNGWLGQ